MLDMIASVIGGGIGRDWAKSDATDQAQANERGAERAMDFSSAEALANRNWQEKMSNTAWQRGTGDMLAAGINPMLAYMKGGASTPSGGQGTGSAAQGAPTRASESYLDSMATAAQIENVQAQTEKTKAETFTVRNQARVQDATVDNLKAQTDQLAKQHDLTEAQTAQVKQTLDNLKQELDNLMKKGIQIEEETLLTHARRYLTQEQTNDTRVNRVLSLLDINRAVNEAHAELSTFKKHISPFLGDAGRVLGSAGQVRDAFRRRENIKNYDQRGTRNTTINRAD